MSTDYGIFCFDCNDAYIIDDMRDGKVALELIENAGILGTLYGRFTVCYDFEVLINYRCRLDLSYFAKHAGHRLDAIDEYYGRYPGCHKKYQHEGEKLPSYCCLKINHVQPCSDERVKLFT